MRSDCTSKTVCEVKKVRYKKLYIKLFYLHKISRKGKLVAGVGVEGNEPFTMAKKLVEILPVSLESCTS